MRELFNKKINFFFIFFFRRNSFSLCWIKPRSGGQSTRIIWQLDRPLRLRDTCSLENFTNMSEDRRHSRLSRTRLLLTAATVLGLFAGGYWLLKYRPVPYQPQR